MPHDSALIRELALDICDDMHLSDNARDFLCEVASELLRRYLARKATEANDTALGAVLVAHREIDEVMQ